MPLKEKKTPATLIIEALFGYGAGGGVITWEDKFHCPDL